MITSIPLALRIDNLGLLNWEIWALGQQAATDIIDTRPSATVLDLGGFRYNEEPLVVALSVLDELWLRRNERRPALLVIDEAHNLCTPDTASVKDSLQHHFAMRQSRANEDELAD